MTGGRRSGVMRASSKSALKEIPRKLLSSPGTRILWNPIEKMKILVWSAITASFKSGLQFFSLKKSVKVAYYKGNIFPGHLIPKKQPVNAKESIITKCNV